MSHLSKIKVGIIIPTAITTPEPHNPKWANYLTVFL